MSLFCFVHPEYGRLVGRMFTASLLLTMLLGSYLISATPASQAQSPPPRDQVQVPFTAAEIPSKARKVVNFEEVQGGSIRVEQDGALWELPLLHTEVDAEISGPIADVELRQLFANPFSQPIEAVYLFPLPDRAAVNDMMIQVGERRILGEIKKREQARQIYEQAKQAGQAAALLDQQRPNLFTQQVANIQPGETIEVTLHFVESINYRNEGYEWVFPMTVGPRYIPKQGTGPGHSAGDEDRISPPYASIPTGHRVDLQLSLNAGVAIQDLRSPSHRILVDEEDEHTAHISIDSRDAAPNKDFILRYDVAGKTPEAAVLAHRSGLGGYFMLMIQPQAPEFLDETSVTPKEMVFVVDTSCSMSGFPLSKAKDAMRLAIAEMNPQDSFTILDFNDQVSGLSPLPLPNSSYNRQMGKRFVDSFRGSGGTQMLRGIKGALDLPNDDRLLRTVLFMTDGFIGNEEQILAAIHQRLGDSRLFSLGIGSSVNRFLLDRMAKVGRGEARYLRPDEDAQVAVQEFYERIRNPVFTDIELDWQGLEVEQLQPDPLPDLFAGQPIVLLGRYNQPGRGQLTIRGRVAGKTVEQRIDVVLPKRQDQNSAIASLWARKSIEELESRQRGRPTAAVIDEITELALEHRLMSQYTSFVAVEEGRSDTAPRPPTKVHVPAELPELMSPMSQAGAAAHQSMNLGRVLRRGSAAAPPPASIESAPLAKRDSSKQSVFHQFLKQDSAAELEAAEPAISNSAAASSHGARTKTSQHCSSIQLLLVDAGNGSHHKAGALERQLDATLEPITRRWCKDQSRYPNGGEWHIRLRLDGQGGVREVMVIRDSLRHGALRKLLNDLRDSGQLSLLSAGKSVEINVVIRFNSTN